MRRTLTVPVLDRLEIQQLWKERFFFRLDLKRVNQAEFEIEEPRQLQKYRGEEIDFTLDWLQEGRWVLGVTAKLDHQVRAHQPETTSSSLPDLNQDLLLRWIDIYYCLGINPRNHITVGYLDGLFENRIDSSYAEHRYQFRLTTSQAYGTWEHGKSDWFQELWRKQWRNNLYIFTL